jgi:uncharacterized protein (TIGR02145 family)
VIINNRTTRTLFLVAALYLASEAVLLSGCSKKSGQETVPESPDTLAERIGRDAVPESPDTLAEGIGREPALETTPETADMLSETCDTLSVSVTYDTFTDSRDGKTYKAVTIGKQTWMAENLTYKPETGNSWCNSDGDSDCKKYGRLYDWETAKTVCPAGWHLPSREEWDSLGRAVGGEIDVKNDSHINMINVSEKLKTRCGWEEDDYFDKPYTSVSGNGIDEYGFSALPGGGRIQDGKFLTVGYSGCWWTATEYSDSSAYSLNMYHYVEVAGERNENKDYAFSVRCLAN